MDDPKKDTTSTINAFGKTKKEVNLVKIHIYHFLNGEFVEEEFKTFEGSYDEGDTIDFIYENYIPSFAQVGEYRFKFEFIDE